MPEFEIKLQVPRERLAAVRLAMGRGAVARQRLRARYYDTPDGRLAARGVVLRLRQEGRAWVQAAKAAGDNALHRLEHEVALAGSRAPLPQPQLHGGTALGDLIANALGGLDAQAAAGLVEQYRTDVTRTTRVVTAGTTQVELALDVGRIAAGTAHEEVCELELELKRGSRAVAVELARQWCETHGLWLDVVSKAERGRRLARGQEQAQPVGFEAPRLRRGMDTRSLVHAVAWSALRQVLGNASAIAAGRYGAEHVHQMRVGMRRLRDAVREFNAFAPFASEPDMAALTACFRALGRHRDATWVEPRLVELMKAQGGPPALTAVAQAPPPHEAVRAPQAQRALLGLLGALSADDTRPPAPSRPVREAAESHLATLLRQLRRDARRFTELPLERQHRLRKRLKRLRYLLEFLRCLYPARRVDAFIGQLKPLQDALGEYQDTTVSLAAWRERTGALPQAWFAVGWLQARSDAQAQQCLREGLRWRRQAPRHWML